jgi:hypothetical protein
MGNWPYPSRKRTYPRHRLTAMPTIRRIVRWLLARLRRPRRPDPSLPGTGDTFLLERYFRRHMVAARKPTRRGRKCRSRMVRMVHAKGLDR